MLNAQNTFQHALVHRQSPIEMPDHVRRRCLLWAKWFVREHENHIPTLPAVITAYPDAKTAKYEQSKERYIERKAQSLQDYAKAMTPIASSPTENILNKVSTGLKRLKDRSVKQLGMVCRFLGLEYLANAIKNRILPKVDLRHAKLNAVMQSEMLNELKEVQSATGIAMPIQPRITESSPCAGQANYDDALAHAMSTQELKEKSQRDDRADHDQSPIQTVSDQGVKEDKLLVRNRNNWLQAINQVEEARARKDQELFMDYVNNRNAEEVENARQNAAVKASKGGIAFNHPFEPVTEKMQQAKIAMDAKMAEKAKRAEKAETTVSASEQLRFDIANAAKKLEAHNRYAKVIKRAKMIEAKKTTQAQ